MFAILFFSFLFFIPSLFFASLIIEAKPENSSHIEYVQASKDDLSSLLTFIDSIPPESTDRKKIVVLPKNLRSLATANDIKNGKIFMALGIENNCVGYKKFFLISKDDSASILHNEIRCLGHEALEVDFFRLQFLFENSSDPSDIIKHKDFDGTLSGDLFYQHPVFYTGADYVDPRFRGNGICTKLYEYSLNNVLSACQNLFLNNGLVFLVYGLTQSNDYALDGSGKSRTKGIALQFYKALSLYASISNISLKRYLSYMPQFDDEGTILPDSQSIRGYGNCLMFQIGNLKKDLK